MKDLTIWCTYHKDEQIEQYGLQENDIIRLFKGDDAGIEGENINYPNPFYSEIVTLYYVWKNGVRSRKAGFCHYRRYFGRIADIKPGDNH